MILYHLLVCLLFAHYVQGQDCISEHAVHYKRIFFGTFHGHVLDAVNKTNFHWALGSCGDNWPEITRKMKKHFEYSYGIDLGAAENNLYERYENSDLILLPANTNPEGPYDMLVTETFYNHAKVRNTPILFGSWYLESKRTFHGRKGTINPGQSLAFVILRFNVHGRDFCLEVTDREPSKYIWQDGVMPIDFVAYNKYFGNGTMWGVSIAREGVLDQQYFITFDV